jgi:hypothetical protein
MKKLSYIVYVHLDQVNGDVVHGRSCKAGKGGQCEHVAAMLYQIIDYVQFKQSLIIHKLIGKSCQPCHMKRLYTMSHEEALYISTLYIKVLYSLVFFI